jgi:hypothetical protein
VKEIDTLIPVDSTKIDKLHNDLSEKLKYLFSSPDFQKEVNKIRGKFNIRAYGIKRFLSVGDKVSKLEERKNLEKFNNLLSLMYDNRDLKALHIKKKSRKDAYQKSIRKIRMMFNLPIRFQKSLADAFIPYGRLPNIYSHSVSCIIRVYDDCGEKRLFIEVFGDTKKQDVVRAWKYVESIKTLPDVKDIKKKKHKFNGGHLFRYKDYYKHRLIDSGQKPVDIMGFQKSQDEFTDLPNFRKNIYKYRYRKHLNKYYSK